ncbi:MAG: preprotein translocase subunit SecA [bacterium]|nr:preprotein translocase subunit SecA [bacterium]
MNFFGLFSPIKKLKKTVAEINALEAEIAPLGDEFLLNESKKLRERARKGEPIEALLPRAFALVRETAKRALKQRHYDAQLMGGIALAQGKIVEMRTGEGKTLAATAPAYLHALKGEGVHVVTVNEYLAKRDAVWMGQIYRALGMSVACLIHEGAVIYDPTYLHAKSEIRNPKSETNSNDQKHEHAESALLDKERDVTGAYLVQEAYLRPISRREAYAADITYGTNHEFGFDYLRDNLENNLLRQVQRGWHYAIIDEVDSILIDEARTPLIISAPDSESSELYKTFARVVARLEKGVDYLVDEKMHSADITDAGIDKVEQVMNIKNIYAPENLRLTHYLQESLKAYGLYLRDRDYVSKDGEIIIVDQFTGRLMQGRRFSGGLHQAIEAKEGVRVNQESRTYAQISIQNYFRLYNKLGGMTGTAQTSAEEFDKVYKLEVVTIPTNREMIRNDEADLIYKTVEAKHDAIIADIKARHEKGQPVLIGTVSIEKNEELSRRLKRAGISHEMLNAKNNEREGAIIAQAGRLGAVTVATNMAGRGVDIILGGNPPEILEAQKARDAGGLHVIGTERHEARRIDNQLRGRAGRQGDPGSSQFFLSLEDDLMRIFAGDRLKRLMERLSVPDDMPISAGLISRAIGEAQSRVEGFHFDSRKHLLEYDDVLNRQRLTIYRKRQEMLEKHELGIINHDSETPAAPDSLFKIPDSALPTVLAMLDMIWMNHLSDMEALGDAVRLRAYGQHDPLVEYKREGHIMFKQLLATFEEWVSANRERLASSVEGIVEKKIQSPAVIPNAKPYTLNPGQKIGRNDPCPCGAKDASEHPIKYKKCHGK